MKNSIFYFIALSLMACKHDIDMPSNPVEMTPIYPCTAVSTETYSCATTPMVSCQNPTRDSATLRCLIVGMWDWVEEGPVFFNVRYVRTPKTEGYSRKMTFRKEGIVEYFKNDTLIYRSPYTIRSFPKEPVSSPIKFLLSLVTTECTDNSPRSGSFYRICNDSLFLDYSIWSDLVGNQKWRRIK
jgi:hypothetical protein